MLDKSLYFLDSVILEIGSAFLNRTYGLACPPLFFGVSSSYLLVYSVFTFFCLVFGAFESIWDVQIISNWAKNCVYFFHFSSHPKINILKFFRLNISVILGIGGVFFNRKNRFSLFWLKTSGLSSGGQVFPDSWLFFFELVNHSPGVLSRLFGIPIILLDHRGLGCILVRFD